jgi:type VI secretion system secreted protein Hcp
LIARKAGGKQEEFFKITFTDVLVSSFQTAGSHGDTVPSDQISINFARIEFDYKEQKADGAPSGSTKAGWDVKASTKL